MTVIVDRWAPLGVTIAEHEIASLLIDPRDPNVLIAGLLNKGVFLTRDRGASWIDLECPSNEPECLARDAGDPDVLWVGQGSGVLRRAADGSWSTPLNADTIDTSGKPVVLSLREHHVGCARDTLGQAWTYVVSSYGTVYRSNDGGASWDHVFGELGVTNGGFALAIVLREGDAPVAYFTSEKAYHRGVIGPFPSGFERIAPETLAGPDELYSIARGNKLWIGTDWGLYAVDESTNIATQQPCDPGDSFALAVSPHDPRRVIVAGKRGMPCVTYDDGATWRELRDGVSTALYAHCLVWSAHDPDVVYMGAEEGSVFAITLAR